MGDTQAVSLGSVLAQAPQLNASDKVRLLEAVLPETAAVVESGAVGCLRSCHGALSDPGVAPSADDIDEVRNEMLCDFPRADGA